MDVMDVKTFIDLKSFIYIANLIGVISFAISGAFKAIRHDHDLVGVTILGVVTATGGGITRDVLLNKFPSALHNSFDIYVAILTVLAVYIPYLLFKNKLMEKVSTRKKTKDAIKYIILISDAVGLSIFVYTGASIGIINGLNTLGVVMMATMTAVGGGVIRDLLANETPMILKEDVYASVCVMGGFLYKVLTVDMGLHVVKTLVILFLFVLGIRLVVIYKNMNLPKELKIKR